MLSPNYPVLCFPLPYRVAPVFVLLIMQIMFSYETMEISVSDRTHVFLSFCLLYLIPGNVFLLTG